MLKQQYFETDTCTSILASMLAIAPNWQVFEICYIPPHIIPKVYVGLHDNPGIQDLTVWTDPSAIAMSNMHIYYICYCLPRLPPLIQLILRCSRLQDTR